MRAQLHTHTHTHTHTSICVQHKLVCVCVCVCICVCVCVRIPATEHMERHHEQMRTIHCTSSIYDCSRDAHTHTHTHTHTHIYTHTSCGITGAGNETTHTHTHTCAHTPICVKHITQSGLPFSTNAGHAKSPVAPLGHWLSIACPFQKLIANKT